jgi:hypothetical protein
VQKDMGFGWLTALHFMEHGCQHWLGVSWETEKACIRYQLHRFD